MALFQGTINQIENNTYKINKIEKSDSDGKQKQYSSNNYPTVNAVTEYVETELEKKADVEYVGGKINEVSKSIANLQNSKANIDDVDDSFKDMQANLNLTDVIVPVGMPHNDKENKTLTFPNFIWNGRLAYISNPTIDYSSFANGDSYTVVANIEAYGSNKYTAEIELVEGTGLSKDGTYCEFKYYASSSAFSYNFRCNHWFTEGIGVELENKADTEYVNTELDLKLNKSDIITGTYQVTDFELDTSDSSKSGEIIDIYYTSDKKIKMIKYTDVDSDGITPLDSFYHIENYNFADLGFIPKMIIITGVHTNYTCIINGDVGIMSNNFDGEFSSSNNGDLSRYTAVEVLDNGKGINITHKQFGSLNDEKLVRKLTAAEQSATYLYIIFK